jgi:hypothetical protein
MLRACACRVSGRSAAIAPDRRAVPRLGFHALFLEVLLWRPYADGDLTRIWRAGGTLHAPKLLCARLSRPLVRTGCARRSAAAFPSLHTIYGLRMTIRELYWDEIWTNIYSLPSRLQVTHV